MKEFKEDVELDARLAYFARIYTDAIDPDGEMFSKAAASLGMTDYVEGIKRGFWVIRNPEYLKKVKARVQEMLAEKAQ